MLPTGSDPTRICRFAPAQTERAQSEQMSSELPLKADYLAQSAPRICAEPRHSRLNQFARFQITSTTSPPGGRTVRVNCCPAIATKRFWFVAFQFGKELPST